MSVALGVPEATVVAGGKVTGRGGCVTGAAVEGIPAAVVTLVEATTARKYHMELLKDIMEWSGSESWLTATHRYFPLPQRRPITGAKQKGK